MLDGMYWGRFLASPLLVATTSGSLCAGAVILWVGVPEFSGGTAAAWASAFATFFAVIVALFVGLFPMLRAQREVRMQAIFTARVVAGGLILQEHNLRVFSYIGKQHDHLVDHWVHNKMSELLAQVNAAEAMQLAPFIKVIPEDVAAALVKGIGILQAGERWAVTRAMTIPYEMRNVVGDCAWVDLAVSAIAELRVELCEWAEIEDESDTAVLATSFAADFVTATASDERERFQRHNPPSSVSD